MLDTVSAATEQEIVLAMGTDEWDRVSLLQKINKGRGRRNVPLMTSDVLQGYLQTLQARNSIRSRHVQKHGMTVMIFAALDSERSPSVAW